MPPTIQKDAGSIVSVSGVSGSTSTTALDASGNIQVGVDNNTFPTYNGLILVNLTASRLVSSSPAKKLVSVTDITDWVKGTADRITSTNGSGVGTIDIAATYAGQTSITILGTIATGTWSATTIAVGKGGTGQTSYTDGQLLIGNSTGNTLAKGTLTGTSNQIVVTNAAGSITLTTPQDIATASNVQFATLSLGAAHSTYLLEATGGDIAALTAGKTFRIKEGSNACKGSAALSGGTVTVTNTAAASGDLVVLSPRGIANAGYLGVTIVNGVSFTIDSSNGADGRTVDWAIIKAS